MSFGAMNQLGTQNKNFTANGIHDCGFLGITLGVHFSLLRGRQ